MSKFAQHTRRTVSAAVSILTAGYFVTVCVVMVILIAPIYLARRLEKQLAMAE